MSNGKAKALILANGYTLVLETSGHVKVKERRRREDHLWVGISWRDLAASFKLHVRRAGE